MVCWDPSFLETTMQGVVLAEFLEGSFCAADIWAEICIYMADWWAEIGIRAALLQTKTGLCGILWSSMLFFFSSQNRTKSNMNASGEWCTLCGAAVSKLCNCPTAAGLMSWVKKECARHLESSFGLCHLHMTVRHKAMLLDSIGQMVGICCQVCRS